MNNAKQNRLSHEHTTPDTAVLHCPTCNKTTEVNTRDELGTLTSYQCGCSRYLWRGGKAVVHGQR